MSLPPLFIAESPEEFLRLNEEDARHAFKVLRLKPGDPVHVADGAGTLFEAEITEIGPKQVIVSHLTVLEEIPPPPFIQLAVSPLKNPDRFEWLVEKATELGVSVISPVQCARTESLKLNIPRLQRIIQSAMKQSRQMWKTRLDEVTSFDDVIRQKGNHTGFIAWCEEKPVGHLVQQCRGKLPALMLIGPEGDFTTDEVQAAIRAGFEVVSLGVNRLRTETAAIAALHSLHLGNL